MEKFRLLAYFFILNLCVDKTRHFRINKGGLTQFLMKSDYLIMSLFLSILLLLYMGYTFYKYKGSLDYKIKEFIVHNNLYSSEISAEVGYLVTDEQILIRSKTMLIYSLINLVNLQITFKLY